MAFNHEMIPKDEIETKTSMQQLKELVSYLYAHGICDEDSITHNLGVIGGWAVYFTLNDHWLRFRGQEYFGSRDIDVFLLCEDTRFDAFFEAVETMGYWVDENGRYLKVIDRESAALEIPTIVSKGEYSRYDPRKLIYHYLDVFCGITCKDLVIPCRFNQMIRLRDLAKAFEGASQIRISGRKIALPSLPDLLFLKGRGMFAPDRTEKKKIKDMCDIIGLTTMDRFTEISEAGFETLQFVRHVLQDINVSPFLAQVSLYLFNERDTDYISRLIDVKKRQIDEFISELSHR